MKKSKGSVKLVFIVGMPAVGKTWWAGKIAAKHHAQFLDLDAYVIEQEKASIPALFASYGEKGFREREHECLKRVVKENDGSLIVACGGGTPCFHDNMKLMKEAGVVIYLQADIPYLLDNLTSSAEVRPMLNNRGDLGAYLAGMLQKRKVFYEQAHHILQAKDISLATFDKII